MGKLKVILNFPAELISCLVRHHDIADDNVRGRLLQKCESRIGIVLEKNLVIWRKQFLHIPYYFGIVIHNEDSMPLAFFLLAFFRQFLIAYALFSDEIIFW